MHLLPSTLPVVERQSPAQTSNMTITCYPPDGDLLVDKSPWKMPRKFTRLSVLSFLGQQLMFQAENQVILLEHMRKSEPQTKWGRSRSKGEQKRRWRQAELCWAETGEGPGERDGAGEEESSQHLGQDLSL